MIWVMENCFRAVPQNCAQLADLHNYSFHKKNSFTMYISKKDREIIKNKFGGKCAYCGCELQKGWHVDHIKPIVRDSKWNRDKGKFEQTGTCRKPENETLENYNPACASCNIQKNSFTVEQFRRNIKQFVNSLNQYNTQYKFAKRYGLVTETDTEVKFYFETVGSNDR